MQVQSMGREDPLEKGVATHSSILAWRIPMDRGAWPATVHRVAKSQTRLKWLSTQHTSAWNFSIKRPRGIGWRGRWEGWSGWGTHVNPWLFHFNVWQNPLQYKKLKKDNALKENSWMSVSYHPGVSSFRDYRLLTWATQLEPGTPPGWLAHVNFWA